MFLRGRTRAATVLAAALVLGPAPCAWGAGCLPQAGPHQPTAKGRLLPCMLYDEATSDEFLPGTGLDTTKWMTSNYAGGWLGTKPASFQDHNVAVSSAGGALLATQANDPRVQFSSAQDCSACGFTNMSTAMLASKTKLRYGFMEIRAAFAQASLLYSFWLQGHSGEMNVVEVVPDQLAGKAAGSERNLQVNSDAHCFEPGATPRSWPQPVALNASFNPAEYHTYGLNWQPGQEVQYYVDGELVRALPLSEASCLDQNMTVILSVETSVKIGVPPASFTATESSIAYFRRWTLPANESELDCITCAAVMPQCNSSCTSCSVVAGSCLKCPEALCTDTGVLGCTDPGFAEFNLAATIDDASCATQDQCAHFDVFWARAKPTSPRKQDFETLSRDEYRKLPRDARKQYRNTVRSALRAAKKVYRKAVKKWRRTMQRKRKRCNSNA